MNTEIIQIAVKLPNCDYDDLICIPAAASAKSTPLNFKKHCRRLKHFHGNCLSRHIQDPQFPTCLVK